MAQAVANRFNAEIGCRGRDLEVTQQFFQNSYQKIVTTRKLVVPKVYKD